MAFVNGILSVLAALSLSYVVLHPNIREGVWIKLGLIVMILSLLASAAVIFNDTANYSTTFNVGLVLRIGIVIVCAGYGLKYRRAKQDGRPTDFGSLTER